MGNMAARSKMGATFEVIDNRKNFSANALVHSVWDAEVVRNGKVISGTYGNHNIVTNEGLNHILNSTFDSATQITAWYVLIFETDTTPAAGTTYATPVFTECQAYDELTREAYTVPAATAQSLTNTAAKATFTMNASKTIYGAALVGGGTDANTKADTAGGGTLYAAAKFGSSQTVVKSDVLQVVCVLTSADV